MAAIECIEVVPGIAWVEAPAADLRVLCGCPADAVKHLMRRGLIRPITVKGVRCETGPNAILLSDVMVQNGAFCNLAEFPVLQMLYRQGMILPGHPNNTGRKPLLIGRHDMVSSQMQYIHRGNYGLVSEDEIVAAGIAPDRARDMMRLKLRFAFGSIQHPGELLGSLPLDGSQPVEIKNGVTVRRTGSNLFEFCYGGETVAVDLNLPPFETHECPYPLGASQFRREYFAVVHSGEGDGWDIHRPSMGSVLVYQGRIYLVDVGPNLPYALTALGIGVNEIEGVFHTHSHDDHFAGLTTLIQADHRIKYYATPLVRAAVTKKWSALLGIGEEEFTSYFDVVDLVAEQWNDIAGLEVRPVFSPHPVETTVFFFRTLAAGGWRSYAHLADIVSLKLLESMITDDPAAPGIDRAEFERVRAAYAEPADVKKVDIGGGLIHGDAGDFKDDRSGKIMLAHTAVKFTDEQKRIGSGASFGSVDVLVPGHRDFIWRSAYAVLRSYFPTVNGPHLEALLNGVIRSFNPETILLKEGAANPNIFLLLTGQVEMLDAESSFRTTLSAGALLGEISSLHELPEMVTYRAVSYVQALEIPRDLYVEFVNRHDLFGAIAHLLEGREFLGKTWLCGGIISTETLNAIAKAMTMHTFAAGEAVVLPPRTVGLVRVGRLSQGAGPGEFFGEDSAVFGAPAAAAPIAAETSVVAAIPAALLEKIPNVRWKLFESFDRHARMQGAAAEASIVN
jgi:hemerythrin